MDFTLAPSLVSHICARPAYLTRGSNPASFSDLRLSKEERDEKLVVDTEIIRGGLRSAQRA
jgi:hypothetical protein